VDKVWGGAVKGETKEIASFTANEKHGWPITVTKVFPAVLSLPGGRGAKKEYGTSRVFSWGHGRGHL